MASICTLASALANAGASMGFIVSQRFLFDDVACISELLFCVRHCAVGVVGQIPKPQALLS